MSLFRKPKNKQFRQRARESDQDDEHINGSEGQAAADQDSIQTKLSAATLNSSTVGDDDVVIEDNKQTAIDKKPVETMKSKLSFHDEEEDGGDVFKVKKSSYSRRFAKQAEKEKKKQQQSAENRKENKAEAKPSKAAANVDDKATSLKGESIRKRMERERLKTEEELNVVWVKSETIKAKEEPQVIEIPAEDPFSDDSADEENGAPTFRSALVRGVIPDAKTIYALKKQRQQRRDADEFIPLQSGDRDNESDDDDRLEAMNKKMDEDDDDDEDGRIEFVGLEKGELEKEKEREAFYDAQQEHNNDDNVSGDDGHDSGEDEMTRWEREQIQRGLAGQQNQDVGAVGGGGGGDMAEVATATRRAANEVPAFITRGPRPKMNLDQVCDNLRARLAESQETIQKLERDLVHVGIEGMQAEEELSELKDTVKHTGREFEFYQILKNHIASQLPP